MYNQVIVALAWLFCSLQITEMFSAISESGQFMVDDTMLEVSRGDSYITVEFTEEGENMYNDTLKCYSNDLSSSVRLHIIAGS